MTGVSKVFLDDIEVLLGGFDSQLAKRKGQIHIGHILAKAALQLGKLVVIELAKQSDGNDFSVESLRRLVGEVRANPIVESVGEGGLAVALCDVGDDSRSRDVDECHVVDRLSGLSASVILDCPRSFLGEYVVAVCRKMECGIQVDGGLH